MEPRGSGASQVGQRPRSSSLEILCWFCLLPFCWWVQEMQMLHSFFFFLPADIHRDKLRTSKYCTYSIFTCIAYGSCQVAMDAEARGTERRGDIRVRVLTQSLSCRAFGDA